jgi:hypothetical protein
MGAFFFFFLFSFFFFLFSFFFFLLGEVVYKELCSFKIISLFCVSFFVLRNEKKYDRSACGFGDGECCDQGSTGQLQEGPDARRRLYEAFYRILCLPQRTRQVRLPLTS